MPRGGDGPQGGAEGVSGAARNAGGSNTRGVARGGCRCGAVKVRATGSPTVVLYCHCRDFRRSSGAPVSLFAGYRQSRWSCQAGGPKRTSPHRESTAPSARRAAPRSPSRMRGCRERPSCPWASSTTPRLGPRSTSGGPGGCAGSTSTTVCRATKKAASCDLERGPAPS